MSDNDIIQRIRDGDQLVTARAYQQYRKEFIRWMRKKYHCSEDDAREYYQLAFFTFYNQILSGKLTHITASAKTYLFGIGKNKFYQQQRSDIRFDYTMNEEKVKNHEEETHQKKEQESRFLRVEAALNKLGEPCRKILMMVYYENRSMEYITQKLGYKNAATTKNQKYKCMNRLRNMLDNNALE
ncbi:MAG: RNA polymerase sigma factor [Cyclobacteriaceae bacterium]